MPPTEANADANVGAVQATTEAAPPPAPKRFVRNQVRGDTTALSTCSLAWNDFSSPPPPPCPNVTDSTLPPTPMSRARDRFLNTSWMTLT